MNATDLLDELRPPLDTTPADPRALDLILHARPEPHVSRTTRYRRPLVAAGAAAVVVTTAVALVPSGSSGPVGIERAAAELSRPDLLLHFTATTTTTEGGRESTETWQTPDGRATRQIRRGGLEVAYDQRARVYETYVPERDETLVDTDPEAFEDEADPFGSIVNGNPSQVGDLPELLERALSGTDPLVRHIGRTTVRGVDVDQIQVTQEEQVADVPPAPLPTTDAGIREALRQQRDAPRKTISIVRDLYVRHDDALPVRAVEHPSESFASRGSTTDFDDVQKLRLDDSTRGLLELADHPTAKRTVRGPFDDSKSLSPGP